MDDGDARAARRRLLQVTYAVRRVALSHAFADFAALGVPDERVEMDYSYWVVESPDGPVVIDSGFPVPEAYWAGDAEWRDVPATLSAIGVRPEDVAMLILTHYHFDHAGHVGLFPRATVVSSEREHAAWAGASAEELSGSFVEPAHLAAIERARAEGRLRLVPDEPTEVAAGVVTHPAPGHTPGQLAVLVRTASGPRLLASDALHFAAQLERGWRFFAQRDADAAARSLRALERLRDRTGAILVPGHEPRVRRQFPADPRAPGYVAVLG